MDGWVSELWTAAKTAGPFGNLLLLFILYFVNSERKDERVKNDGLTREMLTGLNATRESIRDLANLFEQQQK